MDATDPYIGDESIDLKSMTRRPAKITPIMTKAVTQNQEKTFTKRRYTGTRSRKRNILDLKFINAFFLHQLRYPACGWDDSRQGSSVPSYTLPGSRKD